MKVSALPKGKLIKTSGVGSFKYKLSQGTHTTGELHALSEKTSEAIGDFVGDKIRYARKGFSKDQIRRGIHDIKSADDTITRTSLKVAKQILKGMSAESYKQAGTEENKAGAHGQFVYKRNIKPATANHNEHALTSIAEKFNTATVRRSGDATKLTAQGQERAHIFGSINSAIKNKPATGTTGSTKPSNPNFKLRS